MPPCTDRLPVDLAIGSRGKWDGFSSHGHGKEELVKCGIMRKDSVSGKYFESESEIGTADYFAVRRTQWQEMIAVFAAGCYIIDS